MQYQFKSKYVHLKRLAKLLGKLLKNILAKWLNFPKINQELKLIPGNFDFEHGWINFSNIYLL